MVQGILSSLQLRGGTVGWNCPWTTATWTVWRANRSGRAQKKTTTSSSIFDFGRPVRPLNHNRGNFRCHHWMPRRILRGIECSDIIGGQLWSWQLGSAEATKNTTSSGILIPLRILFLRRGIHWNKFFTDSIIVTRHKNLLSPRYFPRARYFRFPRKK